MGLHTGEASLRDGDYYGGAPNRAARIRGLARGGQILCSQATHDLVIDTLDPSVTAVPLGTYELKGLRLLKRCLFALMHPEFPRIELPTSSSTATGLVSFVAFRTRGFAPSDHGRQERNRARRGRVGPTGNREDHTRRAARSDARIWIPGPLGPVSRAGRGSAVLAVVADLTCGCRGTIDDQVRFGTGPRPRHGLGAAARTRAEGSLSAPTLGGPRRGAVSTVRGVGAMVGATRGRAAGHVGR